MNYDDNDVFEFLTQSDHHFKNEACMIMRKTSYCAYLQFSFVFPYRIKSMFPIVIHTNPQSASNWRSTRVRERVNKLTHEHSSRSSSITPNYSHNQPRHVRWRIQVSAPVLPSNFGINLYCLFRYKLRACKGSSKQKIVTLLPFDRTFGPLQLSVVHGPGRGKKLTKQTWDDAVVCMLTVKGERGRGERGRGEGCGGRG